MDGVAGDSKGEIGWPLALFPASGSGPKREKVELRFGRVALLRCGAERSGAWRPLSLSVT